MLTALLGAFAMAQTPVELVTPERTWSTVHDTVMGGISEGRVTSIDGGVRFTGRVSLENYGGFASARTSPEKLDLDGIDTFRIEIDGDGQIWQFTLRRDDMRIRAGSWRVKIQTTGERQVIEIPLTDFEAVSMGRPIPNAPSLVGEAGHIDSVGFLISNKQAGPFQLDVFSIQGVRKAGS